MKELRSVPWVSSASGDGRDTGYEKPNSAAGQRDRSGGSQGAASGCLVCSRQRWRRSNTDMSYLGARLAPTFRLLFRA